MSLDPVAVAVYGLLWAALVGFFVVLPAVIAIDLLRDHLTE